MAPKAIIMALYQAITVVIRALQYLKYKQSSFVIVTIQSDNYIDRSVFYCNNYSLGNLDTCLQG